MNYLIKQFKFTIRGAHKVSHRWNDFECCSASIDSQNSCFCHCYYHFSCLNVFIRLNVINIILSDFKPCHGSGGLNDSQLPKTWEVFVSRHFCAPICPLYGAPGESSCPEGSEYVWQRGVRSQNAWFWAACDQSLSYSGGLIESYP